jgi:hypothetical protein
MPILQTVMNCKCFVKQTTSYDKEIGDINIHGVDHKIVYCSLHKEAERLKELVQAITEGIKINMEFLCVCRNTLKRANGYKRTKNGIY